MKAQAQATLRRKFSLPEEDIDYLDAQGCQWEAAVLDGVQWVFVHDYLLPKGFDVERVSLGLRIVPGYPSAALDMVYVCPAVSRADGRPIGALSMTSLDGRPFQQWSRHYTPARPWRPDIDNLGSHLRAIEEWFRKALA